MARQVVVIKPLGGSRRAGRKPRPQLYRTPRIYHGRFRTGKTTTTQIDPYALGVGSADEAEVFMTLTRNGIPFQIQVNFDGGSSIEGGQRADFVLWDRRTIIEVLSVFHDTPGQRLKDERKWDRRRQEGWTVQTVRKGDPEHPDFEQAVLDAAGRLGIT